MFFSGQSGREAAQTEYGEDGNSSGPGTQRGGRPAPGHSTPCLRREAFPTQRRQAQAGSLSQQEGLLPRRPGTRQFGSPQQF